MKKYLNISLVYAIAAMAAGVFYREFTKMNGFDSFENSTAMGKAHGHLFMLGVIVFLIVALFASRFEKHGGKKIGELKTFKAFLCIYNIGAPLTAVMMTVRGVAQVLHMELSKGANAAISGIAGIGHILTGVGFILLLVSLKKRAAEGEINAQEKDNTADEQKN